MFKLYIVVGVLITGGMLYLLAPILTPFMAAAVLAYLFNPLVTRLAAWRMGRAAATALVFVLFTLLLTGLLLVLVPLVQKQALTLIEALPHYLAQLQSSVLPWVERQFDISLDVVGLGELMREHGQQLGQWVARGLGAAFGSGSALVLALINLVLIPVVTFYLLRDWPKVVARLHMMIPRPKEPLVVKLVTESDRMLSGFLRGQLAVMLALGTVYAVGLTLAGLNTGVLVGLLAGLFSFVPYLGVIVGLGTAGIAMYVQTGEVTPLIWVVLVFGVGQILESFVFQPYFVGDRIGLHPVAVIFAVMAGGQLFGFFGLLLALPVTAVLVVLVRHAWAGYLHSGYYRGESVGGEATEPPPRLPDAAASKGE